jgi:polysaccharide biosynthesis protein VpsQ
MKWLTILFGIFILLVIALADAGRLGILASLYRFPFGDKIGHFLLYGVLALLVDLTLFGSFPRTRRKRLAMSSGLLLALLIGVEEFSQQLFANRTFSLADLSASYVGVACFACLAVKFAESTSPDVVETYPGDHWLLGITLVSARDAHLPAAGWLPAPTAWDNIPHLPRAAPCQCSGGGRHDRTAPWYGR